MNYEDRAYEPNKMTLDDLCITADISVLKGLIKPAD